MWRMSPFMSLRRFLETRRLKPSSDCSLLSSSYICASISAGTPVPWCLILKIHKHKSSFTLSIHASEIDYQKQVYAFKFEWPVYLSSRSMRWRFSPMLFLVSLEEISTEPPTGENFTETNRKSERICWSRIPSPYTFCFMNLSGRLQETLIPLPWQPISTWLTAATTTSCNTNSAISKSKQLDLWT